MRTSPPEPTPPQGAAAAPRPGSDPAPGPPLKEAYELPDGRYLLAYWRRDGPLSGSRAARRLQHDREQDGRHA